jgi:NADPH:quinone reductase-like Zn-dependent oxidoreductase
MKILLSVEPGGPETLELVERPAPQPGPGELLVRVHACGINFPDVLIIEDKYQYKPARPFAPGGEVSGVVEAVGEGVTGFKVGDSIIAMLVCGGLAEQVCVPVKDAVLIPGGLDLTEGAGLAFTYGSALHALEGRGQLKAGETLLILGAAGGVGIAAIEIAKAVGATVVAAVSSEEKAEAARAAGADRTVVYGPGPLDGEQSKALAKAFKEAAGPGGYDVILDPVGGDYAEPALRAIAWGGRYLVVGFPAGIPRLPLNLMLIKSCDVRGVFWGGHKDRDPASFVADTAKLITWWQQGTIRPHIDAVFPLSEGGKAIERLANRQVIGKVVVQIG